MRLKRLVEGQIETYLKSDDKKILFMWGPRRSGKSTVLAKVAEDWGERVYNFDETPDGDKFVPDREKLKRIVDKHRVIFIDEVQNRPEATKALKILHDEFGVKIVATGSSELRQKSVDFDSLAGRFREIHCLPLSWEEMKTNGLVENIDGEVVKWGGYPEVVTLGDEVAKVNALENILGTYILKDIVNLYDLKSLKLAREILLKLALQLGSEVSLRELADSLGANVSTVTNYIEILVKNYVLIPLPSFKTNLRRAISENKKYYFVDLGIRNALVKDTREIELRPDAGGVWENWVMAEVEKVRLIDGLKLSYYFYREYGGKEVDLVIENYKKKYWCWEIKLKEREVEKVFPIEHDLDVCSINTADSLLSSLSGGKV